MYSSSLPADTGLWPLRLRGGRVIFSYLYIEIPPHFSSLGQSHAPHMFPCLEKKKINS